MSVEAKTSALLKIGSLPLDTGEPLFGPYPAMKFGVRGAVAFYAQRLAAAARVLIEGSSCRDWVLTAPPFHMLPAGANLICRQVYRHLEASLPPQTTLQLFELRIPKQSLQTKTAQDFEQYFQYSRNSLDERIRERAKVHRDNDDILAHAEVFRGKGVLVINDIKVTGTQQEFMEASFAQVQPADLHWLYIIEVAKPLGRSNPEIEFEINTSALTGLDDYIGVLTSSDTDYTARCISTLFSLEIRDFETALSRLDVSRRADILALVRQENRYDGEFFRDKLGLLQRLARAPVPQEA